VINVNDTTLGLISAAVPLLIIGFLILRRLPWIFAFFVALLAVGLGYLETTGAVREFGHNVRTVLPEGVVGPHRSHEAAPATTPEEHPAEAPATEPATPPAEPATPAPEQPSSQPATPPETPPAAAPETTTPPAQESTPAPSTTPAPESTPPSDNHQTEPAPSQTPPATNP
jgi:outer membrane biosynthesis protein TonB